MISKTLFTSNIQTWETPQELYDKVNEVFNFNIDLAASKENTKHKNFFSEENSALDKSWKDLVGWANPPFDKQDEFIKKAVKEIECTSVLLIPSRTDTKRWQNYVFPFAKTIIFLKRRIKFSGHKDSAPFPSALVVFSNHHGWNVEKLSDLGYING